MRPCEIAVFGAGIVDIPVIGADPTVFSRFSTPVKSIGMTVGGDAMNEATVLARLGRSVRLISRWGCDPAGDYLIDHCERVGINTECIARDKDLDTGVNIVLVDDEGQRRFYTNPNGSLRKLRPEDFRIEMLNGVKLLSLASIFVFPLVSIDDFANIARAAKERGIITCADFVLPKRGETIADLKPLMEQLDYVFANETEAKAVTGHSEPDKMAQSFLEAGAKNVIIKLGAEGCLIANKRIFSKYIPACPDTNCIDTTGAGDSFAAGFQHALLGKKSFIECAYYANACASVSVEAVGACTGVTSEKQVNDRVQRYGSNI